MKEEELKEKIKEFTKKYFAYNQKSNKLSVEIKQELERLGAWKPYYAEDENRRAIMLIDLWSSNNEKVKIIVRQEAQKHFKGVDNLDIFLDGIHKKLLRRREIAKNMRNKKGDY